MNNQCTADSGGSWNRIMKIPITHSANDTNENLKHSNVNDRNNLHPSNHFDVNKYPSNKYPSNKQIKIQNKLKQI